MHSFLISLPRYYSLALDKTIGANLKGKIVVEYPTFHVTLRDDTEQYKLLDHGE